MKKAAVLCAAVLGIFAGSSQLAFAETLIMKSFDQLQFTSAAMQGEDVRGYLQTMRSIMKRYTDCVFSVLMSNGGAQPSPEVMAKASEQTQLLANEIAAVKAPSEVAGEHKQLAMTLESVNKFLTANAGAGPGALPQALGLIGTVQSTMVNYRNGTQNLIHKYGLPQSLDPLLADQNTADKQQQLTGMMGSMKSSLMNQNAGGGAMDAMGGLGGLGGLGGQGGLGGLGGQGGLGGLGGAGGLGGLGGQGGLGGLGGAGGLGGLGGMSGMSGMDSMFGNSGSSLGGGTTGGAMPNLDVNGLMKQMSDQNALMQQLLGE